MRRTLKRALIVVLVLLLAGYLLVPQLIGYLLRETLRQQGFDKVTIAHVGAESVGGEFRITDLSATRKDGPALKVGEFYVNVAWLALPRERARLQGLALDGVELTLTRHPDGHLTLSGLPLPAGGGDKAQDESGWGFGIDHLHIRDSELHLRLPGSKLDLRLDSLTLSGLRSWDAAHPARLQLALRTARGSLTLDGQLTPFAATPGAEGRLTLKGLDLGRLGDDLAGLLPDDLGLAGRADADMQLTAQLPAAGVTVTQQGRLSLGQLKVTTAGQPQQASRLSWDGKLQWSTAKGLDGDGTLAARDLAAAHDGQALTIGTLTRAGRISWSRAKGVAEQGKLTATDLVASDPQRQARIGKLDWQGDSRWSPDQGLQASGTLDAGNLAADQPDRTLMLGRAERLSVQGIKLAPDGTLDFGQLALRGLQLLGDLAQPDALPRLQMQQATLAGGHIQPASEVKLGELQLDGLVMHLVRDKRGQLPLVTRLTAADAPAKTAPPAGPAPAPATPDTTPAPRQPLHIVLAGLRMGGQSALHFVDHSVTPAFRQDMTIEALSAGRMDSADKAWTPVTLKARLGEYGRLDLAGKAKPLASKVNAELTGSLSAIDLQTLSSYAAAKLGYNLQSGQLDSKLTIKIVDNQLNSDAKLVLNKLQVQPANPSLMARLTRELSMPLDSALNMLRDGDDNIRLNLPVSGDIHRPDFDLSNVINKALGSALKGAAISYLKYALQPYGSLITLAQLAGKAAGHISLKPVPFPAGSDGLAADAGPYLDKLHDLLVSRPQLRVQICGIATEADRKALAKTAVGNDRLLQLANARSAGIKRQLVDRGISPERLFQCNPQIDPAADAKPRAELLL